MEQQPAGGYKLLQLAAFSLRFQLSSHTARLCCVTTEHLVKEREEREKFFFIEIYHIIALYVPYHKSLISFLAGARWYLK